MAETDPVTNSDPTVTKGEEFDRKVSKALNSLIQKGMVNALPSEIIPYSLDENKSCNKKPYKIIYCDPAWIYDDKSKSHGGGAESHYRCSTIEEMAKIPINADKDSVCLMWVTYPQLENGLKLLNLWGFTFKTVAFTWIKRNKKSGSLFFGMGRYTRSNPEIVLLGIKGKGVKRLSASIKNIQIFPIKEHSKKPDEIRELIVKLFGDLPRIELFARRRTLGWDAHGDEL